MPLPTRFLRYTPGGKNALPPDAINMLLRINFQPNRQPQKQSKKQQQKK